MQVQILSLGTFTKPVTHKEGIMSLRKIQKKALKEAAPVVFTGKALALRMDDAGLMLLYVAWLAVNVERFGQLNLSQEEIAESWRTQVSRWKNPMSRLDTPSAEPEIVKWLEDYSQTVNELIHEKTQETSKGRMG